MSMGQELKHVTRPNIQCKRLGVVQCSVLQLHTHTCFTNPWRYTVSPLQDFTTDKDPASCNCAACTSNLHSLGCQLSIQAKDRGHTLQWLEDWLERALGCLAGRTRGRVVRDPAHVAASTELDNRAIQTTAVLAGLQLGDDGALVGLDATQEDIDAALAAPTMAAGCRALGDPKSFPRVLFEGSNTVHWDDIAVSPLPPVASMLQSERVLLGVGNACHKRGKAAHAFLCHGLLSCHGYSLFECQRVCLACFLGIPSLK